MCSGFAFAIGVVVGIILDCIHTIYITGFKAKTTDKEQP